MGWQKGRKWKRRGILVFRFRRSGIVICGVRIEGGVLGGICSGVSIAHSLGTMFVTFILDSVLVISLIHCLQTYQTQPNHQNSSSRYPYDSTQTLHQ